MLSYQDASDILFAKSRPAELASVLGCGLSRVNCSRLDEASQHYRHPPVDWRAGVVTVAQGRIAELQQLIRELTSPETIKADLEKRMPYLSEDGLQEVAQIIHVLTQR